MSFLNSINSDFIIEAKESASTEDEIMQLINFSQIEIPKDFLDMLCEFTEVEIKVGSKKYVRLWGALGCIDMNESYNIQTYIPESLAFADDEGGNTLIYTVGQKGFGIYLVAFNDLDINELQYVAKSVSDLFINGEGVDVIINN